MYYEILTPLLFDYPLTYRCDLSLSPGDLVKVPFRNKEIMGVVIEEKMGDVPIDKIKVVILKYDDALTLEHLIFIRKCAAYTFEPQGDVLKRILSGCILDKPSKEISFDGFKDNLATLSDIQQDAYTKIKTLFSGGYVCAFLDGVTGSGKTEVYFHLILDALKNGKQILVLQPEIALSTSWFKRFENAFGVKPLIWHSQITPAQKRDLWKWSVSGKPGVLVGARSALFLPLKNIGLIIVDEEHDASYKQEEQFIYQGRDMAVMRAYIEKCPILLCSATPSIETYENCNQNKYTSVRLDSRFQDAQLPDISLIDLKAHPVENFLSPPLIEKIQETFDKGEQSLLFLNRKGYAPLTLCKDCGVRVSCPNCALNLVEHKSPQRLVCHHCGYVQRYPKECSKCGEKDSYIPWGPAIGRLEETIKSSFPHARVESVASDEYRSPKDWEVLLKRIADKEIDIILATQILAKGHHFPGLTFIGVIDGDFSLNCIDLRAAERTFQLLSQVSGRAGRDGHKSCAMIQTHEVDHPVLKAFMEGKRDDFLDEEITLRKNQKLPPFAYYIGLIFAGGDKGKVEAFANKISIDLYEKFHKDLMILGPIIAPLSFLKNKHRYRILLKSFKSPFALENVRAYLLSLKISPAVSMKIDVDPYHFL